MSIFIAILGLAFLIFIHEAGHFFAALAVGMRPRSFYIGFPPRGREESAERHRVRDRRDPARRLREDPGDAPAGGVGRRRALRPRAPGGARAGRAARAPQARARRRDVRGGRPSRRRARGRSATAARRRGARAAERGVQRARATASARRRTGGSARGSASRSIVAGPATNLLFAVVLFAIVFMAGGGKATTTVDTVLADGRPAHAVGLRRATRSSPSTACP